MSSTTRSLDLVTLLIQVTADILVNRTEKMDLVSVKVKL